MKKTYKILELVSSTLESKSVSEQYGYGQKTLYSYLYREIDDTDMSYEYRGMLDEGFNSLEEAESFIEKHIGEWDNWTIICEYRK